jgi:beta-phosphoglucomutase family hydrolase
MPYEVTAEIEGLIFDFDGTIVDSMPAHYRSWKEAFSSFGADFSERFFYDNAGMSLIAVVETYNRERGTDLPPAEVVALKDRCHADYLPTTRTIPEVMAVVARYQGVLKMAVATGSTRKLTLPLMERLGLTRYFDAVVFGEDVAHSKPHPESFLRAAEAIRVAPVRCEVFEDGEAGIEAARRAGMKVTDIRPWLTAGAPSTGP